MADLQGGFSDRVKAVLISSSFILAILGWAFQLGVTYARQQTTEVAVDKLQNVTEDTKDQVSTVKERLSKLEAVASSIDQTLKDIRADLRATRQ